MNPLETMENIVSLEEDQGESAERYEESNEKENKAETRINTSISGNGTSENPIKIPSDLVTLPSNNVNKSDFGPLSPVQLNISSKNKDKTYSKKPSVLSQQDTSHQGTGVKHGHKQIEKRVKEKRTSEGGERKGDYVYEEGLSLIGDVAILADAEEEEQIKRIMVDEKNMAASNQTILDQSKKLVDFLGGSIKTALQQNSETNANQDGRETMERTNHESDIASSEDPSLQRLNNFVGDLIGKLGSANPMHAKNDNTTQPLNQATSEQTQTLPVRELPEEQQMYESTNNQQFQDSKPSVKESPVSQPKSKYWETLMIQSEESKDMKYDYCDSPCHPSLNDEEETTPSSSEEEKNRSDDDKVGLTNIETPCGVGKLSRKVRSPTKSNQDEKCENEPSPQSMISVPMDYSPGDSELESDFSPLSEGIRNREDNSPGSTMFNMISAATNVETPLICRSRLIESGKSGIAESSPAISAFGEMISTSTTAKTPDCMSNTLDLTNRPANSASIEQFTLKAKEISSRGISVDLLEKTPIKSNKTEIGKPDDFDSFLQSDCDESEDGSIYTSFSYRSSIQSNTPNSRRVTEWLDPNAPNTVSWPTTSVNRNMRSSERSERSASGTKYDEQPMAMGTGQFLTLQKQIRTKSKAAQNTDWRLHRPLHMGHSTSPNSLPSLLGSTTCNEVSDLESPNIINFPLNFKFSEEESTIHSQSAHECSEINSAPDCGSQLHIASPHSLMTEVTPSPEPNKFVSLLGNKIRVGISSPRSLIKVPTPTVGYPTDEECSPNSKSPKDLLAKKPQGPSTETFSFHTSSEDSSPKSADIGRGFEHDDTDDKTLAYLKYLKRCIAFGMLVAFVGAITVITTAFINPSNVDRPMNSDEEWKTEVWKETSSPTSDTSISLTVDSPTLDSTSFPTSQPTLKPTIVEKQSPTMSPVVEQTSPSSPPTRSPNPLLRPTTSKVDSTVKTTLEPTAAPIPTPTFSKEEINELTWHRIVNGENIWRSSGKAPLWFLAADGTPGIKLNVINAAKEDRLAEKLEAVVDDYRRSKAVESLEITNVPYEILCAPPEIGEIKVCSGDFGDSDWIGSTLLFMRDDYIVSALIRINESSSAIASDALLRHELCHQMGHSLGVVHNDAVLGLSSCMKDFGDDVSMSDEIFQTNQKLQHPNSDDLDFLVTLYGAYSESRMLRRR